MNQAQFEREKNYQASLCIAKTMLEEGLIDSKEYGKIKAILIGKYKPIIGGL
jgi:hypothetical protein